MKSLSEVRTVEAQYQPDTAGEQRRPQLELNSTAMEPGGYPVKITFQMTNAVRQLKAMGVKLSADLAIFYIFVNGLAEQYAMKQRRLHGKK